MESLEKVVRSMKDIEVGSRYRIIEVRDGEIAGRGQAFEVISINGSKFLIRNIGGYFFDIYNILDYTGGGLRLIKTS
ncbi:MAG: hypothetical protein AABX71_01215 [Nanoarchaeota archaeon]